eukprot:TRINITY_DN65545_c0_g1_i1.p1 TRINITY_DN65545_c0_g1~~TRINITY_DN65545_c0_g1_i1.p1  ORF type:complete len:121 (+),score=25.06 TRINITY_DN65545_c0_g1_i1:67-429(+)
MIRRPPRSTLSSSSAASDVYKRQHDKFRAHLEFLDSVNISRIGVWCMQGGKDPVGFPCAGLQPGQACPWFLEELTKWLSLIHISEPTRLLSISYAVFCLKKKKRQKRKTQHYSCQDNIIQ